MAQANAGGSAPIIVTGSRIRQDGMQTPVPVTAVQADALEAMAPTTIVEGLSQLPQFYGNQTPNDTTSWFERGGYGNLNLRGLGINRTLTLLNGRRIISANAFGGVDTNASAAYGTDAVAGVVNFILDTDFDGLELTAQGGITSRGDSEYYEVSGVFGTNIGSRGHFLISAERFEQEGVHSYDDRDWYNAWGTVPDATGQLLIRPNVISNAATFDGLIFAPGSAIDMLQFRPRPGPAVLRHAARAVAATTSVPNSRQSIRTSSATRSSPMLTMRSPTASRCSPNISGAATKPSVTTHRAALSRAPRQL
jgi:outer membrane receptor protein involved in Fe transport